ncbi:MAG TPA: serine/threonine-protein kinase, partial [Polyangiales bacterium]
MPNAPASGRYQLEAEIARGGMGVVYRAHDRLAQRHVAYKRLIVSSERQRAHWIALFQREYHTLTQLVHPAIVTAYEFGFDEQAPFYTMELLAGGGLTDAAPLLPDEVCRVIRDVASALGLLHARRLLHRDLSPANVRIQRNGRTKLIDFGALAPFGPVTDVVGTAPFMAPESLARGSIDQRSDLYSLGALAYWALTRATPVRARSLADLPAAWDAPIIPPSQLESGIPPALEELVLSLLSRDPLARPASAAEVIERLTGIAQLGPEPDEARVASSYLERAPLVGRAAVLERFEQALLSVPDGGRSLLVEAEQGLGRSALLEQLVVQAHLSGATVLRGDVTTDASPFGLTRGLPQTAVAHFPELAASSNEVNGASASEVTAQHELEPRQLRAVPPLRTARARAESAWSPVEASERQARTLAHAHATLLRASRIHPLVIVVDDLVRADAESMALLATLCNDAP